MNHILSLGFNENDALVLYENKEDWMGLTSESKVMCTYQNCKFKAPSSAGCLTSHVKSDHKWKDLPCNYENCKFVAYNTKTSLYHKTVFHAKNKPKGSNFFPCPRPNCKSSFRSHWKLAEHERIHDGDVIQVCGWYFIFIVPFVCLLPTTNKCAFCPYRTVQYVNIKAHYRYHYNMLNYKCDPCGRSYVNSFLLQQHIEDVHSREQLFTCHICKGYTGSKHLLQKHLRHIHKLLSKWNPISNSFQTYERD